MKTLNYMSLKNVELVGEISIESPNDLFRMKLFKPLESCW